MMTSRNIIGPVLLGVGWIAGLSCGGPGVPTKGSPPGKQAAVSPSGNSESCVASVPGAVGSIQFLVDDSGSMSGFRKSVSGVASWIDQSLSSGPAGESSDLRTCYFGGAQGIQRCRSGRPSGDGFRGQGETALDKAVAAASDRELTIIFTDGVASTASGGGSDCARGVDTACVAMRLENFARAKVGGSIESNTGIWLVPIKLDFAGILYTEEPHELAAFDAAKTMKSVTEDLNTTVKISGAKLGVGRLLEFDYVGPRYGFLLVLSKEARTGRSFVQELVRRAKDFAQTGQRASAAGIVVEPPLELFPGYIGEAEEIHTAAVPDRFRKSKNFATLRGNGTGNARRISCDSGVIGEVTFTTRSSTARSTCAGIASIPVLEFDPPIRVGSGDKLPLIFSNNHPRTTISCDSLPACTGSPATIRFPLKVNGRRTVTQIDQADSAQRKSLDRYGTSSLALSPHRILSLGELVRNFYSRLGESRMVTDWTVVSFCRSAE